MIRNAVRPTTLIAILVEVVIAALYLFLHAPFHYLLHLLVGTSAALLLLAAFVVRTCHRPRNVLAWVVTGQIFASLPDLLFRLGIAHQHWMDLFTFHINSHFLPGRLISWYVILLICLAVYLRMLSRPSWPPVITVAAFFAAAAFVAHEEVPVAIGGSNHLVHAIGLLTVPLIAILVVMLIGRKPQEITD